MPIFARKTIDSGLSIVEILISGSILALTFMYIANTVKVNDSIIRKTHGLTGISDIEDEIASTMELAVMDTVARGGCGNLGMVLNALNSYSLNLSLQNYSGGSTADFPCPSDRFSARSINICKEVLSKAGGDFFSKFTVVLSGAYYFKGSTNLGSYINCNQINPSDTYAMAPYGGDFFYSLMVVPKAPGDHKPSYRKQYRHMRLDWKFLNFVRCLGRDDDMAKGLGDCI